MLKLLTPATELPLTLEEVKTHLRIDGTEEDAYLGILIGAAVEYAQNFTNQQLMPATYLLTLESVPSTIPLSRLPFAAVTEIKAEAAEAGEVVLVEGTDYTVTVNNEYGDIAGVEDSAWFDEYTSLTVEYVVGYADASAVPSSIKAALLLIIGHLYTNREEVIVGTINGVSKFASEALLSPYRIFNN